MNSVGHKFVRFEDWHSDRSVSSEHEASTGHGLNPRRARPSVNAVFRGLRRGLERGSDRIRSLKKPLSSPSVGNWSARESGSRSKIHDPQGSFLQNWNKIFVIACVIAVSLDPLFLYTAVVDGKHKCVHLDKRLQIITCVLRSFIDVFHVIHIIFQFRTGFIAPSSRVFGRGELIDDPLAIAKRYLSSYFIIDVLAILPLPQMVVFFIIPISRPVPRVTKDLLLFVIVVQYVPRLWRIYPLYKEVTRTSGFLTETAWAGAAYNLLLYMLASHVVGAFWYLFSMEREYSCWHNQCRDDGCKKSLYCDPKNPANSSLIGTLTASCPFIDPDEIKNSTVFNFGIFTDALQSGVLETRDFPKKFLYCFWWGLRNLSSLGQNLKTSTYVWEIVFAVFISIFGLVLFSLLIGNMQKFLQSTTLRVEEMRVKRRDAEQWMSHRMLPENLRERIRRYDQYKWQETRGVEEETLVCNLPKDLRKDIKRHLCLALLNRWRTWSACFIQAAWRRHCKRKLEKSLREAEDRLQDALTREAGSSPSLLATVYASKFAANALRNLRQNGKRDTRPSPTLLPLLPQKPAEPDFTAEHHD
ncbi:hypothetical protein ACE6H2_007974 [Prunus campanulata]